MLFLWKIFVCVYVCLIDKTVCVCVCVCVLYVNKHYSQVLSDRWFQPTPHENVPLLLLKENTYFHAVWPGHLSSVSVHRHNPAHVYITCKNVVSIKPWKSTQSFLIIIIRLPLIWWAKNYSISSECPSTMDNLTQYYLPIVFPAWRVGTLPGYVSYN